MLWEQKKYRCKKKSVDFTHGSARRSNNKIDKEFTS